MLAIQNFNFEIVHSIQGSEFNKKYNLIFIGDKEKKIQRSIGKKKKNNIHTRTK